jgi:hypothetical protein
MLPLLAASFPFSRDESTQWVVLAAGVVATLYVIMRSKSRSKRVDPLARQSADIGLAQQRQVERDISQLMVEMLETARQMTAQLDPRAAKLELLIRQADERLAAIKSTAANGSAAPNPGSATRPDEEPQPGEFAPDGTSAMAAPAPETAPEPVETPPDPRHAEIYALADQGRSPYEIARSLDRPNGEVELILALRRH